MWGIGNLIRCVLSVEMTTRECAMAVSSMFAVLGGNDEEARKKEMPSKCGVWTLPYPPPLSQLFN